MKKYFIITVDTEGDNLWTNNSEAITVDNWMYIPRFQTLCEDFGFKPVYLTNYEMLICDDFVRYIKEKAEKGLCEVGLHLHAWNNPPEYELTSIYNGKPYLIEYPEEIMHDKFDFLYHLFIKKMGFKPISHRSGRWAMNDYYFSLLKEYGIKVDCSVSSGINWSKNMGATRGGSDYSTSPNGIHYIDGIFEVPPTIRESHFPISGKLRHRLRVLLKGEKLQLRPATNSLKQMKHLVNIVDSERSTDYLEFMLHSSELMPGCSPYFPTNDSIEQMYNDLKAFFSFVKSKGYFGITLSEYFNIK